MAGQAAGGSGGNAGRLIAGRDEANRSRSRDLRLPDAFVSRREPLPSCQARPGEELSSAWRILLGALASGLKMIEVAPGGA